jgi:lipopolysaccharide export system permease protein
LGTGTYYRDIINPRVSEGGVKVVRILQRYYLREFTSLFAIVAFGLGLVFSLMDLINKINDFMPHKPSMGDLFLYAGLTFPQYLLYLMPMASLLSGLFVFGQAGKRRETLAIKASGGSIKTLLMPFVYLGIVLSIASFLMGEFVVPYCSRETHLLRDALSKKENILTSKEGTLWLRTNDAIVKIDLFLPGKGTIKGVTIMRIEHDMLTERTEAESAEWRPALGSAGSPGVTGSQEIPGGTRSGVWQLRGVTQYTIKSGTITKYKELQTDAIASPEIFRKDVQQPEEMNVRELTSYTQRLKSAGFRNTKLLVDIQSRISYPLINAIMLVLGIALAVRGVVGGGLVTAAIGIFISLFYWVAYTTSLSLGYTGILPPVPAAWLMPLLFGGMAWYLFRKVPE